MSYSNDELRSKRKFQWANNYVITDGVKKVLGKKCRQRDNIYWSGPMWLAVSSNGKEIANILENHSSLSNCEILEVPNLNNFTVEYFADKKEGIDALLGLKDCSFESFSRSFAERVLTKHRVENFDIYVLSYIFPTNECIMARETVILRDFEF